MADTLVRFDHAHGFAEVLWGDADATTALMEGPRPELPSQNGDGQGHTRRFPSRLDYEKSVRRAIEHIRAGDAFQIVLSQRAERPTAAGAIAIYRTLRRINPSPYTFLLDLDGIALIGSSPETLVKLDGRRASVNPIAGTIRRGPDDVERLLASEKDRAEHVMLVDLGRNDLSRVCEAGSVEVVRFLEAERFSHVTHLVSEVAGDAPGRDRAVRPAARLLPRRNGVGRAEGARDADHLRARGLPARAVRGRGRLPPARRLARHVHRHPDDRPP